MAKSMLVFAIVFFVTFQYSNSQEINTEMKVKEIASLTKKYASKKAKKEMDIIFYEKILKTEYYSGEIVQENGRISFTFVDQKGKNNDELNIYTSLPINNGFASRIPYEYFKDVGCDGILDLSSGEILMSVDREESYKKIVDEIYKCITSELESKEISISHELLNDSIDIDTKLKEIVRVSRNFFNYPTKESFWVFFSNISELEKQSISLYHNNYKVTINFRYARYKKDNEMKVTVWDDSPNSFVENKFIEFKDSLFDGKLDEYMGPFKNREEAQKEFDYHILNIYKVFVKNELIK